MALFYAEAILFLRAGDDMRSGDWPEGDFIREVVGEPRQVDGYEITPYVPTQGEQLDMKWRRA